ncbi:adenine phosphoribosyltransferase [Acetobacterium carbinolicum]|jgi:adenine phosphoribosyltransferase|uniref:adenine phosphoribosyltransferase n=1 Tax=Acetobacterium TaxID=33951 RepID=UPI000DBEB733|nr:MULTISPECIES: adenine phosphoribosyltransferase [unclassified Acetobacterium]AWW25343.1 adenine phosphoribosyltransferase [Acetobacterium sp. KB-1]MDK2942467.1 adenine phosphoribosyltransferase [Acetobacterium sp.]MDZ5723852.1 adenine phosphoribosyltransferase [Acetobacterium sp. K1/6]
MDLKENIGIYEDFPKEGISFKDINSLILNPKAFQYVIDEMAKVAKALDANIIVIPEARGYIFGTPLAYLIGAGLVPIRKPGKLPGEISSEAYDLEYGSNVVEMQKNAIKPGDRIIIVDDLLATGGTMMAATKLIENLGGEISGIITLIELTDLGGRELLKNYFVHSIVTYPY